MASTNINSSRFWRWLFPSRGTQCARPTEVSLRPHDAAREEIFAPLQPCFESRTLAGLKAHHVSGPQQKYSFGRKDSLADHTEMLVQEFAGRSQLELYHALLIVLIRRQLFGAETIAAFLGLWRTEGDFLRQQLDARWLLSACDTLCDHAPDPAERGLALAAALTWNTIKLYETERLLLQDVTQHPDPHAHLTRERIALFDGMSAFVVGYGDMVGNLYRRAKCVSAEHHGIAGRIVLEMLERIKQQDTVFGRFRAQHIRPETCW